ncbi:hypothetical protein Btru_040975 [Bulinus truncatus]|nr:hypothetical protein Btru_040975 [Bulinus truncatus]
MHTYFIWAQTSYKLEQPKGLATRFLERNNQTLFESLHINMGQAFSRDIFFGQHEVEEQYGQELECTKLHNGHRDMILANEFTRDHLPEPYNKIESLYKLTKAIAFLTVRLKINCVSPNRPEFIPNTQERYPLYDKKENIPSLGTGRICDVELFKGTPCTCHICAESGNPSPNSYLIRVFTTTHVIHDDVEAKDAICPLFHDGSGKRRPIKFKGFTKIWSNVGGDLCLVQTVSCDEVLCPTLFAKIKKFNGYWQSLKYMQETNKNKEQLVIIVGHPHGLTKRISVGYGVDIGSIQNLQYSKFIYNAPTCPGTSGAPVYILGYDWFDTEFVHVGALVESPDIAQFMRIHSESFSKLFPSYDVNKRDTGLLLHTILGKSRHRECQRRKPK